RDRGRVRPRGQLPHAGARLEGAHARGRREEVRRLVPGESELPEPAPARPEEVLLVLQPPLGAAERDRIALVRSEEPQVEIAEEHALVDVAVLLELPSASRRRPVVDEGPRAGLDVALQPEVAEFEIAGRELAAGGGGPRPPPARGAP